MKAYSSHAEPESTLGYVLVNWPGETTEAEGIR